MSESQQEFLNNASRQLRLSHRGMALRMGTPFETYSKWLLPPGSGNFRHMPKIAWNLIREILAHERLKQPVAQE